jgi:hypothetical protein
LLQQQRQENIVRLYITNLPDAFALDPYSFPDQEGIASLA